MRDLRRFISIALLLALCACGDAAKPAAQKPTPAPVTPAAATPAASPISAPAQSFNESKLREIDATIEAAIADHRMPGGVIWIEHNGQSYHRAYGQRALQPERESMTEDTIFDAASLTKVLATTPSIMLLLERGLLKLDEPVKTYFPEFAANGKDAVTLRHVLTHTAGLRPGFGSAFSGYDEGIALACAEKLQTKPGTEFKYSDISFVVLGEIVRRVSGKKLNEFAAEEIYKPLKMNDTTFLPAADCLPRIAPTEQRGSEMLRGKVHDPKCSKMGGVAGHAGLFTTAADVARFARMMLAGGELDGVRLFKTETVKLMTSVQTPSGLAAHRGLGWDIDTGYSRRGALFPTDISYGHTGFTGTSIWIDPYSHTFVIFMTNRVHPDGKGNILSLQSTLSTLAAESLNDVDFTKAAGYKPREKTVLNGIDVLASHQFAELKGLRIGLITNQTGIDRQRTATIDLLKAAPNVTLKALFSPEHGIRGDIDAKVSDSVDEKTGLPVFSLYGESRKPAPEQLKDLDALVFDIQDIGCRFYTYISTLGLAMEAASQSHLKFFVLDRVNPVNGISIEGPVCGEESSFTAFHPLPVRHGMTVGELARMFNAERNLNADLTIVPVEGWSREMWFDQTGLPWVNPSPNMRNLTEAALYPGIGLLEMNPLSVGRGTDTPFELIGAPYVDDVKLAAALNGAGLSGVRFVPIRFMPLASVFKNQRCGGVSILLTDRTRYSAVDTGITAALALQRLYGADFSLEKFNTLLRHSETLDAIRAQKSLPEIHALWAARLEEFKTRRAKFLIYK
jgi:uncharacterized protein YbbC (DUF1343 family)